MANNEVIVAMVPWPEHGHLNQLFHLSRLIAFHNIPVHFISLAARNHNLKHRLRLENAENSYLHFRDLSAPPSSPTSESEEPRDPNDDRSFMVYLKNLDEPIYKTCLELSNSTRVKRLIIIHDSLMGNFMGDVFSISNVEIYSFHPISAFSMYSMTRQVFPTVDEEHDAIIRELSDDFPTLESCFGPDIVDFFKEEHETKVKSREIMNSCRDVEGRYIDLLSGAREKPLWGFGPFHMLLESLDSISSSSASNRNHKCLEFLDKQDVNSVIFVSFGTTTTLSQEQVNELALGLEQSNHKFIWVLREADKKIDKEKSKGRDRKVELPEGFEVRVEGRGMVVKDWAPQSEILEHSSTGGFLSHCGWNSCMESISKGVPIAAWPIHVDQPFNSVLVTTVLKVGISVRNWARREELVTASTVEKAIKTLMGSPEGEEIRRRTTELSKNMKNSVSHDGLARKEMESFISYITR